MNEGHKLLKDVEICPRFQCLRDDRTCLPCYMSIKLADLWFCCCPPDYERKDSGTCKIIAAATDGLTSDNPKKWYSLSCGHKFTIEGLDPIARCPVCERKVEG